MGGSFATMALNLGAAAGPVIGGLVLAADGRVLAPIGVAAGLSAAAVLILWIARARRMPL
jgi:DHA1 family chloramphenicol resistance protein-like MFS transporter